MIEFANLIFFILRVWAIGLNFCQKALCEKTEATWKWDNNHWFSGERYFISQISRATFILTKSVAYVESGLAIADLNLANFAVDAVIGFVGAHVLDPASFQCVSGYRNWFDGLSKLIWVLPSYCYKRWERKHFFVERSEI